MLLRTGNNLGARGVQALVPALTKMPHLATLSFQGASGMCAGWKGEVTCAWVRTGNWLDVAGAKALAPALMAMPQLTSLNLRGACGMQWMDVWVAPTTVLEVRGALIGGACIVVWAGNDLHVKGARVLAKALMKMTRLRRLDVGGACAMLFRTVDGRGELAGACMLVWADNELGEEAVRELVPALMAMPHLTSLDFRCAFGVCDG